MAGLHCGVGGFEVAGECLRVEEWGGLAVLLEALAERLIAVGIVGEIDC